MTDLLPPSNGLAAPTLTRLTASVSERLLRLAEPVFLTLVALGIGLVLFSTFLVWQGVSPYDFARMVWLGGFGSLFSLANAMERAAPLVLAALCVALPARLGLVVIGGEGAVVVGGLAAAVAGQALGDVPLGLGLMASASMLAGALWIGFVGLIRFRRGVNETISSLLLSYIAIALMNHLIEGPLRDPASLNKPATFPIAPDLLIPKMPWIDAHWGLVVGAAICVLAWCMFTFTSLGMAVRIAGANPRAAQLQGLPVGRLIVGTCAMGGALTGLAGMFEVAAVHGTANGSLASGFGFAAILVSFLARHNPLAIVPIALFLGGLDASSGLVQRRLDMPDASMMMLQGTLFMAVIAVDTLRGRLNFLAIIMPPEQEKADG